MQLQLGKGANQYMPLETDWGGELFTRLTATFSASAPSLGLVQREVWEVEWYVQKHLEEGVSQMLGTRGANGLQT